LPTLLFIFILLILVVFVFHLSFYLTFLLPIDFFRLSLNNLFLDRGAYYISLIRGYLLEYCLLCRISCGTCHVYLCDWGYLTLSLLCESPFCGQVICVAILSFHVMSSSLIDARTCLPGGSCSVFRSLFRAFFGLSPDEWWWLWRGRGMRPSDEIYGW